MINVQEVKEKILAYLDEKGPSLPIPISKTLNIQSMLASAILSELINEKKVEISNMRIGNSPLYFIPSQNAKLEPFADNLHGVEKEAFNKLKENQILIDSELEPAERVALRHLKDFAISFKPAELLVWRYFLVSESQAKEILKNQSISANTIIEQTEQKIIHKQELAPIQGIRDVSQSMWQDIEKQQYREDIREKMSHMAEEIAEKQKELDRVRQEILSKVIMPTEKKILEIPIKETIEKKGKKQDPKQAFLLVVKEFIAKQNMELVSVEGILKKEVLAKVRLNTSPDKVFLLIAFDKRKLAENDIIRAYRKASKIKLPFYLAYRGEFSKKTKEKIDAFKNLLDTGILA